MKTTINYLLCFVFLVGLASCQKEELLIPSSNPASSKTVGASSVSAKTNDDNIDNYAGINGGKDRDSDKGKGANPGKLTNPGGNVDPVFGPKK